MYVFVKVLFIFVFRLLKYGLQETFNLCILEGRNSNSLNKELFKEFTTFMDIFLSFWNKQQEAEEVKQRETDSLYKTRYTTKYVSIRR